MTRLILIRHGETAWTRQKRYQGRTDIPLSPSGKKQIVQLSKRLRRCRIHFFYSSALTRATQTAAILSKGRKTRVVRDERISEFNFGRWEGKTASELLRAKDPSYKKWCQGRWVNPPGGETIRSFKKRHRDFLAAILKKHEGKTIAIVSHGGPVRMMLIQSLGLPWRFFWKLHIEPASVSVLHFHEGSARWAAPGDFMDGNSR